MRKIFLLIGIMFCSATAFCASDNIFRPKGDFDGGTVSESATVISSNSYSTSAAIDKGVYRHFQNVGDNNINFFYVLTSSNNTTNKYLISGEKYIEDNWFGAIYWKCPAGSTSTLNTTTIINN